MGTSITSNRTGGTSTPQIELASWSGGTLPTIPPGTTHLFLEVDASGGELNLTGWNPTGLEVGAAVVVRKVDSSNNKVVYNDGVFLHDHVNRASEILCLTWLGTGLGFKVT